MDPVRDALRDSPPSAMRDPTGNYRDRVDDRSWGMGTITAIILGALIVAGGIWYGMSDHGSSTASNPPAASTGQGGTNVNPGAGGQNAPNPARPGGAP